MPRGAGVAGEDFTVQVSPQTDPEKAGAAAADKHWPTRMLYMASLPQVVDLPRVTDNLNFKGRYVKADWKLFRHGDGVTTGTGHC